MYNNEEKLKELEDSADQTQDDLDKLIMELSKKNSNNEFKPITPLENDIEYTIQNCKNPRDRQRLRNTKNLWDIKTCNNTFFLSPQFKRIKDILNTLEDDPILCNDYNDEFPTCFTYSEESDEATKKTQILQ